MDTILLIILIVLSVLGISLLFAVLLKKPQKDSDIEIKELKDKILYLESEIRKSVEDSNARQFQNISQTFSDNNKYVLDSINRYTLQIEKSTSELKDTVEKNLDRINKSVTEQLEENLQKRLDSSYSKVNESLERIHKWLGEMQELSTGVTDLKKVLTGVKTRGEWGEASLGAILEQILTIEQYSSQVNIKGDNKVDFAIILPGKSESDKVLLPIDAKFPVEDYQRLCEAQDLGDAVGVDRARKDLVARVKHEALSIRDKYVKVPKTTDFAIMYVPTEGLFAELLRSPGLQDFLQTNKVVIAGPTTITALLNSLRMGFKTLAIEKRSTEIGKHLATFQRDFGIYLKSLNKTHDHLEKAQETLGDVMKRSETIQTRLKKVEQLPGFEEDTVIELIGENNEG